MSNSTTFSNGTVIQPAWLNDINKAVFTYLPNMYAAGVVGDGVTDDTTNFQTIVTACNSANIPLFMPNGTVLVTANITNLHSVLKIGNGAIKRGTDTFYINPTNSQTNTIYVSTTGSASNDGLTAALPTTFAQALTYLALYNQETDQGNWVIQLAAGTYTSQQIDFPVILSNRNRVTIQGPIVNHPNVPTAIFDGGSSLAYGLNFNSRAFATISNIKFQNYTTYGSVSQDLCDLTYVNVHVQGITGGPGIKMQQGRLRVQGGIIQSCQTGINVIGGTTFTIGDPNSSSLVNGTQILNCTQQAVLAQEQSSGHCDYVTITNCAVGLDATVHSRFHAASCAITNNATAGVRCADASSWFDNGTSANFSGNGANELMYDASGEIQREGNRTWDTRYAVDQVFGTTTGIFAQAVVRTYTGDIAKNSFNSPLKAYRMIIRGTTTGTVGTKNITVNVAGSNWFGFTIPAANTGDFVIEANFEAFGSSGTQQSYDARFYQNGQALQVVQGSRSINMMTGSAIDVTILLTVNGAADTISIRAVNRYSWGGC